MPMNTLIVRLVIAAALAGSSSALAQATVVSAPAEPSLLNLTRQWSRESILGDLREIKTRPGYFEVRVWRGFDDSETRGIVLRQDSGQWHAWLARVARCAIQVPIPVADTASRPTVRRYLTEARKNCGNSPVDVSPGARIFTTDTLVVERIDASVADIAGAWEAAIGAGLFDLPARVNRASPIVDATTYVVEVRRGNEYRASQIEHVVRAESAADAQVKEIHAAVSSVLPQSVGRKP
jgi:hypothetical protein